MSLNVKAVHVKISFDAQFSGICQDQLRFSLLLYYS